jgi:hypothetical protein
MRGKVIYFLAELSGNCLTSSPIKYAGIICIHFRADVLGFMSELIISVLTTLTQVLDTEKKINRIYVQL